MNILYIHQYFKTPKEPGGTRSYWLAQALVKQGYNVTMLTTSNHIKNNIEKTIIDGINVIYLKVSYRQDMSIFERLLSFSIFMFKSTYYAYLQKNIDLVFATSTPLSVGFPALIIKKIKNIPYVFEVRDLWPEVPIQMGAFKNKIIKKLLIWFEKLIYKNAEHIVALSPGMAEGVLKYESALKVSMISNMSKVDSFWPREKNLNLMKKLKLNTKSFKLIHFGSLGQANGAFTIIESAKLLKNNDNFEFIFIGGGSTEQELKDLCTKYNLKNVHFLGSFPLDKTSEIVNLCDVSIVSFLDLPILYTNSPNKLFDSLSAGKPIIVNSAGWTKDLVEKHSCGFYVNPNIPIELVNKLKELKDNIKMMKSMSNNGRLLAETVYDKSILCNEFLKVINKVVDDK
jgi:glycosyltransferase involved in cell wall biosynthesis